MTSERFFVRRRCVQPPFIKLEGEEHHHLSRVVRKKPGDQVRLFDEEGTVYLARVEQAGRDHSRLMIVEVTARIEESSFEITLAQALLKSKKMDFLVQKGTEWGMHRFLPVVTARAVVRLVDRAGPRVERWRRIVREAVEQSGRSLVPEVCRPEALDKIVRQRTEQVRLFLSERGGAELRDILRLPAPDSGIIPCGPEGGWTEKEESHILESGFRAVSLGSAFLRAETAALGSLAMVSHFWNP